MVGESCFNCQFVGWHMTAEETGGAVGCDVVKEYSDVIEWLGSLDACGDAIEWCRATLAHTPPYYEGDALGYLWRRCERSDWKFWLLGVMADDRFLAGYRYDWPPTWRVHLVLGKYLHAFLPFLLGEF